MGLVCLKVHYTTLKINKYNLAVLIIEQFCTLDVSGKNVKYDHFKSRQKMARALIFNF